MKEYFWVVESASTKSREIGTYRGYARSSVGKSLLALRQAYMNRFGFSPLAPAREESLDSLQHLVDGPHDDITILVAENGTIVDVLDTARIASEEYIERIRRELCKTIEAR